MSIALKKKARPKAPGQNNITNPAELPPVYAMICLGDCMMPEIRDGECLDFDRDAPVERGDLAVFFLRPELVQPGALQARVKRLALVPPPWVTFPYNEHPDSEIAMLVIAEQLNPPRQYRIKCSDLLGIHLCIGSIPPERLYKADIPESALDMINERVAS